jgi:hypothetical protein
MRELFLRLWDRLPLQFRVLHRQFLLRVIDLEALSIEADIPRFLGQFAGILIMISLLKCLGTLWFPPPPSMALVVEHGQIENMLLVIGLIVVLTWDATFPDRRDVMVLAPLPVKARTILLARIAASATLLGIAIAALNFASSFSYALVFGRSTVRFFIAYWFTMTAGAALIYGSVLTMQGITALLLPRRMYLRLSAILQLAAYVLVLATYFLPGVSLWGDIAQPRNHWMAWAPSIWLLALLNQLNGSLPPEAAWLAWRGWMALGAAVAGAFAALAMCYLRTMKKTVEEPDLVPGAGGFHWAPRLGGFALLPALHHAQPPASRCPRVLLVVSVCHRARLVAARRFHSAGADHVGPVNAELFDDEFRRAGTARSVLVAHLAKRELGAAAHSAKTDGKIPRRDAQCHVALRSGSGLADLRGFVTSLPPLAAGRGASPLPRAPWVCAGRVEPHPIRQGALHLLLSAGKNKHAGAVLGVCLGLADLRISARYVRRDRAEEPGQLHRADDYGGGSDRCAAGCELRSCPIGGTVFRGSAAGNHNEFGAHVHSAGGIAGG